MKQCRKCRIIKELNLFTTDKKSKDKKHSYCKECLAKIQKEYRTKNREWVLYLRRKNRLSNLEKDYQTQRKDKLKSTYGLTLEDYDKLLAAQNNRCAICYKEASEFKKPLFVDHCHVSGKVRGLLCHHCNVGLGNYKDSIKLLTNAIEYLKEKS